MFIPRVNIRDGSYISYITWCFERSSNFTHMAVKNAWNEKVGLTSEEVRPASSYIVRKIV